MSQTHFGDLIHQDYSVSNLGFSYLSALTLEYSFQLEALLSPLLRRSCLLTDFQYKQPLRSLGEHICPFPSSLSPSLQHSSSPIFCQCVRKQERKGKADLELYASHGVVGFQDSFHYSNIMACLNLSLAFLGKSKEIGGPWGMQSVHRPPMWPHVIHGLVMHCTRARCFA